MMPPNTSQATMYRLLAALLLIPLLVAACGGGSASPSGSAKASARPSGAASEAPSEFPSDSAAPSESASAAPTGPVQLLTCSPQGPGWAAGKLDGSADAEGGTTAAAKALLDYVTGADGTDLPDTGWHELYRSKDVALYGQADPSGEPDVYLVATIRATDGVWAGEDNGQCRPQTWLGSSLGIAATWRLSAKTTRTSKTLKTLVTERACASGASAKGRIAKPKISYEDDRVVITIGVTPLAGEQDCKSNPATPLTVTLSEALGDRQLFDGGPYPAAEVAQPK
jgi:hypothetical protein